MHFFGYKVNADFEWIGSWISIVSLATATIVEVAAYYLPCVENLLDLVNVPLAFVAGAVVMSGVHIAQAGRTIRSRKLRGCDHWSDLMWDIRDALTRALLKCKANPSLASPSRVRGGR